MLNLFLFVLAICFVFCTVSGVIGFFIDLKNFKAVHEFSGNRKQLIEYLMSVDDVEDVVPESDSEVIDSEN